MNDTLLRLSFPDKQCPRLPHNLSALRCPAGTQQNSSNNLSPTPSRDLVLECMGKVRVGEVPPVSILSPTPRQLFLLVLPAPLWAFITLLLVYARWIVG